MMPTKLQLPILVLMTLALQFGWLLGCERKDQPPRPQATSAVAGDAEGVEDRAGSDMDDSGDADSSMEEPSDDEEKDGEPGSSAADHAKATETGSGSGSGSVRNRPPFPTSGPLEDVAMWTYRWGTPDEVIHMHEEADIEGVDLPQSFGDDALTPLHVAVCNPDPAVAELLMKAGAPLEARDRRGNTPLLTVTLENPFSAVAELLLKAGADPRAANSSGISVLHAAATYGTTEYFEMLLKVGADVNCRDSQGATPLHRVAAKSSPETFALLLKAGADPKAVTSDGWTVLHAAARNRVDDTGAIVRMLIEAGCDIAARDDIGWVPLHYAARFGGGSAVEALVRSYEGRDGKPVTGFALVNAATPGGYTPLHAAIENDDPKPAKVLVDSLAAVNVTASGEGTPLQLAVKLGRGPDYVGPLIEGGADLSVIDGRGCSLLHRAVQGCPVETVRLLIDAGIPVDIQTPDGFTPLHLAAQEAKDPRVIEFLLKAGADPRGKGGPTPHSIARPEYRDILWKALVDSPLPTRPR